MKGESQMYDLIDVKFSSYKITKDAFPYEVKTKVFIQAHGESNQLFFYYVDLGKKEIKSWIVNIDRLTDLYRKTMMPYQSKIQEIFQFYESFLYIRTLPHSACYFNNQIFISPVHGNFVMKLDLSNNKFSLIMAEEYDVFSSTNHIVNNNLYLTRWNLFDSLERKCGEDDVNLEFVKYNISCEKFDVVKQINGPDGIHQTAVSDNGENIIAVEMSRFSKIPMDLHVRPNNQRMKELVKSGISDGRIINYNTKDDTISTLKLSKGSAHVEFDVANQNVCYISLNNLLSFNCFGPGEFVKIKNENGLKIVDYYRDKDLFRIPSHKIYEYKNKSYLVTIAYPSLLYIIDAETMKLWKKIYINNNTKKKPNFENGPYQYPIRDFTPYSVNPIQGTPLVVLVNLWEIKIIDIESEKIINRFAYNYNNDSIDSLAHSLFIN